MLFRDRTDAGRLLAEKLAILKTEPNVLVLGVPRGGVMVAAPVADALSAPLDVFMAHKIGAPFNPELAVGALTGTGEFILDQELIRWLGTPRAEIDQEIAYQREEIARRLALFRGGRPPLCVKDHITVAVDDGVATGFTMLAVLQALAKQEPARLVLAIPVGPSDSVKRLGTVCDQVVVLYTPDPFLAVGCHYLHFGQTSDQAVCQLLANWKA